jgi:murein DD-endopeptidase MepM/ murein hydrolase activator NlpD
MLKRGMPDMRNGRAMLLTLALMLCLAGAAQADVGDVTYGPWSEWAETPIENRTDLFVETRKVETPVVRSTWRYTRYRAQGGGYTATGTDKEVLEVETPLKVTGEQDGRAVYEGDWFNQGEIITVESINTATQYRARQILLTSCALEPSALIAEAGEHVQLGVKLLDSGAYTLTSDHPDVAAVDQQGVLAAKSPGRAQVTLDYNGQTATCDVLVTGGKAELKGGAAALRLSGTSLTARYDVDGLDMSGLKLAAEGSGAKADPEMRFLVDDVDGDCCSLRSLCPLIGYLAAPLSDEGDVEAGEGQVLSLRQVVQRQKQIAKLKAQQPGATSAPDGVGEAASFAGGGSASYRFRALKTPEGDLILCLQADGSYALTADRAEAGAGLSIEKLNLNDPRQRWTLVPEKADVAKDLIWRLPVPDNSFCQITDDFKTMARDDDVHDGVDFSPIGRERALAVAAGRVVRVDDRCTHDYRKTKLNKYGRYIDPCDLKDGIVSKYGSYGKYVIVEHADGSRTMYAHLSKILVRSGQKVRAGQAVGVMGSTGSANGIHLHFEVRVSGKAVDPRYFFDLPEIGGYVP